MDKKKIFLILMIAVVISIYALEFTSAQESKPIKIYRFENKGNDANFDTGISANDYHCVAAGWAADYDIQETDSGTNMVWTYVSGNTWWVRVQFHSHKEHESPDVDVVCFSTNVAEWVQGDRSLNHPD